MLNWPAYHIFLWNGLELGWNGTKDIQADQFGSFASPKCPKNCPKGPNFLPNRLKITLWQHKLAHMAYVGVEKKPKWSAGLPTVVFQPCFIPSNPK